MNTFKRKALFTAVVAGLGAAGTAEAVYLSPNNMGQVLVYPYYTTQTIGGTSFTTLITARGEACCGRSPRYGGQ